MTEWTVETRVPAPKIDWSQQTILVVSPHADDEVSMAGGLMQQSPNVVVTTLVIGDTIHGKNSAITKFDEQQEAIKFLGVGSNQGTFSQYNNGRLYEGEGLRNCITWLDNCLERCQPGVVVLPKPSSHQDHRFAYDAGIAALRPKQVNPWLVLLGEVQSNFINPYEPDGHRSYLYVALTKEQVEKKSQALALQKTQIAHSAILQPELIEPWARMRGMECCAEYAERFEIVRCWM
jgi:LmbE family N-acetylglucosaminyl deacetylase